MIPIHENYRNYRPPRFVYGTVEDLLASLTKQYVSGLKSVVLTNSKAIGRGKTGRVGGKKYKRSECLGFYYPKRTGEAPWIEIVVDNTIRGLPRVLWLLPLVRKVGFANTLFHEVGHHLEHTIGAPARRGEAAAEAWDKRLVCTYLIEHYGLLMRVARLILFPILKMRRTVLGKRARGQGK